MIVALALLGSDLVSAFAALALIDSVFGFDWSKAAVAALPVLIGAFYLSGLYSSSGLPPSERVRTRLFGTLAFMGAFLLLCGDALRSNAWLVAACQGVVVLLLGYYAEVLTRQILIRSKLWGAPTAFVGSGIAIEQAHRLLSAIPELGLRPVGRIGLVDDQAGSDRSEIEFVVTATKADFARIANTARLAACPPRVLLLQTKAKPAKTFLGPGTLNLALGRDLNAPHNRLTKRAIDLALGIPALLLALPLIGVVALAIKLFSPGPAFYAQTRVGFMQRSFKVLKLRTMHGDAEQRLEHHLGSDAAARLEWDRFCKLSRDPRVLPYIGNLIRRTSIDELPQLLQVVSGEMSLIGPRPFPTYHTERFDPEFQALRASVPAGLTGLWQVSSRSNGDIDTQKTQDLYYIRNWSIWLDLYILLQTIPAVVGARGDR